MCVAEFRLLFPQLTGVLTLAFFIHNCVITLMKSNRHQENNVGLAEGAWPLGRRGVSSRLGRCC